MHMSIVRARFFLVIILLLALVACATPALPIGEPVPPGYLYKAKFLDIRSPNEAGWYLAGAAQTGIQFTRHGDDKGETFAAQVTTFPLPEFQGTDEFVNFIKRGFQADTDSERFSVIQSNFKLSTARKYRCVDVSAVIEDKQALTSPGHHGKLMLQSISLYCRHPVNQLAGFAIIYSHRGKSVNPDLAKEANAFIAGVQVPGY